MKRILVGIDSRRPGLWACIHAMSLAKRMGACVSFLLVGNVKGVIPAEDAAEEGINLLREKLEGMIEKGRSEDISVDFYITHGDFEKELLKFIRENRVTLLVLQAPGDGKTASQEFSDFLEKISRRIDCRIEVVYERNMD
ncbi:MAG: universal stress protein [Deltaproteobacteria bacterium]|nr:universal stress protein [Deltaproteobacteria bacterium]MBW2016081.1 universal stress protein [Deltaproteobacteria bacterium]MBW2130360.1 universal stress protein [Deltaproteobacteria bacterium]